MKRLFYTVAFAVLGFTASYAQKAERQKITPEVRAQKYAANMQQKLNLSDEQKAKIEKLELDRFKKFDADRKASKEASKAKFEARKAEMKAHQDKLNQILTKEQQEKLAADRAEMKQKAKDRFKGRKGHGAKMPRAKKDSLERKS